MQHQQLKELKQLKQTTKAFMDVKIKPFGGFYEACPESKDTSRAGR
jgi:hypothetical protein